MAIRTIFVHSDTLEPLSVALLEQVPRVGEHVVLSWAHDDREITGHVVVVEHFIACGADGALKESDVTVHLEGVVRDGEFMASSRLDAPDRQGYWAFEGIVGDDPGVAHRQDVIWVHNIELNIIVSTFGARHERLQDYHGKWTRLTMPWEAK